MIAHMFLNLDIAETPLSPLVVKHPFTDSSITGLKSEDGSLRIGDLLNKPDDLAEWRKMVGGFIDEAESATQVFSLITKSYLLAFLAQTAGALSEADIASILPDVWMRTEAPHNDPNVSRADMIRLFRLSDPAMLMDEKEYRIWQELDDIVTVFRGVTSYNAANIEAFSWSLNRDVAEWFAHRFGEEGTVYEAQIPKERIFAVFNGRNEMEAVVDPRYLQNVMEAPELEQEPTMAL